MRRNNWPVADYGVRPAGPQDACFYCQAKLGTQHRMGCVIRDRTIVVRLTVEYVRTVPEDWSVEQIEFFHNEGTRCSDNDIEELQELCSRLEKDEAGCLCDVSSVVFVREATAEDEKSNLLFVEMCSS